MNSIRTTLFATLLTIVVTPAFAQSEAEFKKNCTRMCAEVVKAFNSKSIAWFQNNSTSDFVYIDAKGTKSPKKDALAGMGQMFQMAKSVKATIKCGAMTWKNGVGTHANTMTSTIVMVGPDKKPHTMVQVVESVDTYKKVKGKWMITQVKETKPAKTTMDGKPFNPEGGM